MTELDQGEPAAGSGREAFPADHKRAFTILHASQRALLRAKDEAELLDLICRVATEEAGYRLAWAGIAEADAARTVRPVAQAGFEFGYLESISVTWADTPSGQGPTGVAIRTGRPAIGQDFLVDPALAPWRDEAIRSGFGSSLALPLVDETGSFGAFMIYAARPHAFSAEDVELLTGLADDLAFGITTLRGRAAAVQNLRRSERNLNEAQRISHIGSWEWDLATDTAQRSDELHRIYGVEPGEVPGVTEAFLAFVHPDDRERVRASERAALSGDAQYALDYRVLRPDGTVRHVRDQAEVVRDEAGAPVRLIGTVRDVTEQVAAEEERTRLVAAVEQTADAVWMQDLNGIITYVNRSFTKLYGYAPEEIVGLFAGIVDSGRRPRSSFDAIWASVVAGQTWSGSIINRRKDGSTVELEAVISGIRDASGRVLTFMQTDRDVTRERGLESALERQARERDLIEAALARIDSSSAPELIAAHACAEMIGLPGIDSAFVISLDDEDHGLILAVEGQVAAVFESDRVIPGPRARYLFERASVGVWTEAWRARPEDGIYGEKVAAAGLRMVAYAPLRGSGGVIGVVGLATHERARDPIVEQLPLLTTLASILGPLLAPGLEARYRENNARASIQGILDIGAFAPFFQPIVELHTGAVVGFEALTRFSNGSAPDTTFALAARSGLGLELEAATLKAAISAAAALPPSAYLSLNTSPQLIQSGQLQALIGGSVRRIVLEITEHEVIEDYHSLREDLARLRPVVELAVDDAGAGYASLRHILELAPAFVKLDIGLIRGINADPARQALITGMGYFAAKRRLKLIAEGVETPAELEAIRSLGIGYGQGYLLGRPQDGGGSASWATAIPLPSHTNGLAVMPR